MKRLSNEILFDKAQKYFLIHQEAISFRSQIQTIHKKVFLKQLTNKLNKISWTSCFL